MEGRCISAQRFFAGAGEDCRVTSIVRVLVAVAGVAAFSADVFAAEFLGWQGLRVVPQEGTPERMTAADLDGDGRQELIVVNTRQSRLDLYRWQAADERKPPYASDPDRPNELPLAPDWSHTELALEDLPADAAAADLDGDGRHELLVLTGPTLKLSLYEKKLGKWESTRHWDLPTANLAGRGPLLLVRQLTAPTKPAESNKVADSKKPADSKKAAEAKKPIAPKREALISCDKGILVVPLDEAGRAGWLRPRETVARLDWRQLDVDGDGDDDLIEWTALAHQTIRWYENVDGVLRAPQTLHDQQLQQFAATRIAKQPAEVHCLASSQTGLVRRFRPAPGEKSDWGRRSALPIGSGPGGPWCGIRVGKETALAAVDPVEPRIRLFRLVDDVWGEEEGYPGVGNVRAIAAPAGRPGMLLLWVKDAGDLFESHWDKGRLTYPKPVPGNTVADRKVLAMETVGATVWSAQRIGADVELCVWSPSAREPEKTKFAEVGAKTERVLWLGGKRLLVQQAYSSAAKIISIDGEGKTVTDDPPHLAKVNLAEYSLYDDGRRLRLGRLTDGVLQWLDDDLQPTDQVMLGDGRKLAGFVGLGEGDAVALEQGGLFLHRLKIDESGIVRTTADEKIPSAAALRRDPILGLFLIDADHVTRLGAGRPWELKLVDTLDGRIGRPSGVKEATVHRVLATDVDGDGSDEVLLCDDRRHQLTVLRRKENDFESIASWQVFEDKKYPYGDDSAEAHVSEPRSVLAFDADGDSLRELALLSQDRLVIYVGQEAKP